MTTIEEAVKAAFEKGSPSAVTDASPPPPPAIPPHIAGNLLEFLRRVKSEGLEAIAWVEAYQFLQQHAPQQGIPFTGLPPKQP